MSTFKTTNMLTFAFNTKSTSKYPGNGYGNDDEGVEWTSMTDW